MAESNVKTIDEAISPYFDNFKCLIYAMQNLTNSTNGKLYWFDYHLKEAAFSITTNELCSEIEKYLLTKTSKRQNVLYCIILRKIQEIESLLSDKEFKAYYNKFKSKRIEFKEEYYGNNFFKPQFIIDALPLFPNKTPKAICYGTLQTFHKATLDYFNDGKNRINKLFPLNESKAGLDEIIYPDFISKFEHIESQLMSRGFLAENFSWVAQRGYKKSLCEFLVVIIDRGYTKQGTRVHPIKDVTIRRFFEGRYGLSKAAISDPFKPTNRPDLNSALVQFSFIPKANS